MAVMVLAVEPVSVHLSLRRSRFRSRCERSAKRRCTVCYNSNRGPAGLTKNVTSQLSSQLCSPDCNSCVVQPRVDPTVPLAVPAFMIAAEMIIIVSVA